MQEEFSLFVVNLSLSLYSPTLYEFNYSLGEQAWLTSVSYFNRAIARSAGVSR